LLLIRNIVVAEEYAEKMLINIPAGKSKKSGREGKGEERSRKSSFLCYNEESVHTGNEFLRRSQKPGGEAAHGDAGSV